MTTSLTATTTALCHAQALLAQLRARYGAQDASHDMVWHDVHASLVDIDEWERQARDVLARVRLDLAAVASLGVLDEVEVVGLRDVEALIVHGSQERS